MVLNDCYQKKESENKGMSPFAEINEVSTLGSLTKSSILSLMLNKIRNVEGKVLVRKANGYGRLMKQKNEQIQKL